MSKYLSILTKIWLLLMVVSGLSGCVTTMVTGGQLVYDRYLIGKNISNQYVAMQANHLLFADKSRFVGCNISTVSFNHDLLLVGQVQSIEQKQLAESLVANVPKVRRLFNQLTVGKQTTLVQKIKDSWLTTKIRSHMLADSDVNQKAFKVVTEAGVVYILGDVKKAQAKRVVELARLTKGVTRVVKVMRYYQYV